MNNLDILATEIGELITRFIENKFQEYDLHVLFPNPLLREDVIDILDKYCTVVYYPIQNESNNGFHITNMPFANGSQRNFVFINTAQTMEKQVFTAAHELGHIWKVDDFILSKVNSLTDNQDTREHIINRFAAILLMPKVNFVESVYAALAQVGAAKQAMPINSVLEMIVVLMNQFFVPMKAVVLRMLELDIISSESAAILLGQKGIPESDITQLVSILIKEHGFQKFQVPSEKKWIDGLSEMLDTAEKNGVVPKRKIAAMRSAFDLTPPSPLQEMDTMVSLNTQERPES